MQNNCYCSWSEFSQFRRKNWTKKKHKMKVKRQNGILFLAFRPFPALVGLKIRARSVKKSGRVPSSVSFSFQFPPNLPNWAKVLCHNQPGSKVRISNECAERHEANFFRIAGWDCWDSSAGHIFIELLIGCHIISSLTTGIGLSLPWEKVAGLND